MLLNTSVRLPLTLAAGKIGAHYSPRVPCGFGEGRVRQASPASLFAAETREAYVI